jgi:hypothetical protein
MFKKVHTDHFPFLPVFLKTVFVKYIKKQPVCVFRLSCFSPRSQTAQKDFLHLKGSSS